MLAASGVAGGASGDLKYKECDTAETESGATGSGACDAIASAASAAANSGMAGPTAVAVSPSGTSLYVASLEDDAIAHFSRNRANGNLTYEDCITGETQSGPTGSGACEAIPSATSNGANSGMDTTLAVEVAPDGRAVYAIGKSDDAVVRFSRDRASGGLTFEDCITGESASALACAAIPGAAAGGENAGLNDPQAMELTEEALYIAGLGDEAVVRFSREPASGELTYEDCITGDTAAGPSGTAACDAIPSAAAAGSASGLSNPIDVAVSRGSLYIAAQGDTALARFKRDTSSGELTYKDCITGGSESGPAGSDACDAIPSAASVGMGSGLSSLQELVASRDGGSLYATASGDGAVARFDRSNSGKLTFKGCLSAIEGFPDVCKAIPTATESGEESGLDGPGAAAISSDGASLYVTSSSDDAVTVFARVKATGKLTHRSCVTGEVESGPTGSEACSQIPSAAAGGTNSGLANPQALALSADDASLYVGTSADDSIARFSRKP